ncbi:hypothetical protein MmiHf6_15920 [Methanimicrococcus hongohii]|uniref:Uncharacterized protein n=1 Tax=Methanimicrococcus hongohii TaxID=3028295 RepID=A0AA96ZUY6_9EURY|nr:hypothetical protein [Methanimicrococcus sp. Hf6]WNY24262.1 hypothetical protein MmiHf6_15920 [Methanimicrococcus sp. Hf6]
MHAETFDEIFTYAGRSRQLTPEEKEEECELIKLAEEDIEIRQKLAALGLPF